MLAPVLGPVFVTEPAAHTTQSLASSAPVVLTYFPAAQSVQAVTLDEVEYLPAAHMAHLIAPVLLPLSVTEPALQLLQFTPASHGQYIPAVQGMHSWPRLSWNFPGGQFVHLSALRALYFPATHTVQPRFPSFD
jgi:hypothetical protein